MGIECNLEWDLCLHSKSAFTLEFENKGLVWIAA